MAPNGVGSVAQEGSPSRGQHTILLVEDESAVRDLAARILREAGHDVIVSASGHDAIAKVAEHGAAVDLLLTDVLMRGMSGRELADHMRTLWPDLPILFMSGYSPAQIDLDPAAYGAGFLEKPFAPSELEERVRSLLAG